METITISKATYDSLIADSEKLYCLEQCGVEDWIGYYNAMAMWDEDDDEDLLDHYEDEE